MSSINLELLNMMGLKISSKSVINLALRSLKFLSIYFISWFLRLLRVWHWTDDQSDINQASWYKLIVKLKLWLVQAMWVCDCLCFQWNLPQRHQPPVGVYTHNILCIYLMIGVSADGIYFGRSSPPTLPKSQKLKIHKK